MNNELYYEYERLLKQRSKTISDIFCVEYEEIFSEACLILVKSFYTFDPDKGQFTTHLFHSLNELFNFAKKNYPTDSLPENYNIPYTQRFLSFSDEYNFSGLEKDICDYAESNFYIAEKKTCQHITKADIKRHFIQSGYTAYRVNKSLENIERSL